MCLFSNISFGYSPLSSVLCCVNASNGFRNQQKKEHFNDIEVPANDNVNIIRRVKSMCNALEFPMSSNVRPTNGNK